MRSKTTILMYHSVAPDPDAYGVSPDALQRHLAYISEHYPVAALKDISRCLAADRPRTIVITVDDAFRDFAQFAQPIFQKFRMPVTMFVPTSCMGKWNLWDDQRPDVRRKEIMTSAEIRALAGDELVDIGSHGVDHVSMRSLPIDDVRVQATTSRATLEDLLGRPVKMFSYPYGQRHDFSSQTGCVLAEAGYDLAVTTCWGTANSADDLFRLRRIYLDEHDSPSTIRAKIEGRYDWKAGKERLGFLVRYGLSLVGREFRPRLAAPTRPSVS